VGLAPPGSYQFPFLIPVSYPDNPDTSPDSSGAGNNYSGIFPGLFSYAGTGVPFLGRISRNEGGNGNKNGVCPEPVFEMRGGIERI